MPITRLSKTNMRFGFRRARKQRKYMRKNAAGKKVITRRGRKAAFEIAWNRQRAHVKKTGHR